MHTHTHTCAARARTDGMMLSYTSEIKEECLTWIRPSVRPSVYAPVT